MNKSWSKGYAELLNKHILVSIVVSIPACHAGDPGSIPGRGVTFSDSKIPLHRVMGSNPITDSILLSFESYGLSK